MEVYFQFQQVFRVGSVHIAQILRQDLIEKKSSQRGLGEGKFFKNVNEAILAYENGACTLHTKIRVRVSKQTPDGQTRLKFMEILSTVACASSSISDFLAGTVMSEMETVIALPDQTYG